MYHCESKNKVKFYTFFSSVKRTNDRLRLPKITETYSSAPRGSREITKRDHTEKGSGSCRSVVQYAEKRKRRNHGSAKESGIGSPTCATDLQFGNSIQLVYRTTGSDGARKR